MAEETISNLNIHSFSLHSCIMFSLCLLHWRIFCHNTKHKIWMATGQVPSSAALKTKRLNGDKIRNRKSRWYPRQQSRLAAQLLQASRLSCTLFCKKKPCGAVQRTSPGYTETCYLRRCLLFFPTFCRFFNLVLNGIFCFDTLRQH